MALWAVGHPKGSGRADGGALLVLTPEHWELYKAAGYRRGDIEEALWTALRRPATEVERGVGGVAVGTDPSLGSGSVDKFADRGNLLVVRAGGRGGPRSVIIPGWIGQGNAAEIRSVTKEVER